MNTPNNTLSRTARATLAAGAVAAVLTLAAACGSTGTTSTGSSSAGNTSPSAAGDPSGDSAVLPVKSNPITNTSMTPALIIDSVLVENNVDSTGNDVDDHLEIAVSNSGDTELSEFEVYYTFTDPKTYEAESYYSKLPSSFTIAPGVARTIHFDDTGAVDHFPTNRYSLYYTDPNALDVSVEVSATDSAPQTLTVVKDAGGAEEAD